MPQELGHIVAEFIRWLAAKLYKAWKLEYELVL